MATATAAPTGGRTDDPRPRRSSPRRLGPRILGKHPLGWLFSAPYLIFLLMIFAYPLIFAGYMSFHDYFFAAPGVVVDRPFVGLENYTTLFTDPAVRQSFFNVGIWDDVASFKRQIIDPFVGSTPTAKSFEYQFRERMILSPVSWRAGKYPLPDTDHFA